MVETNIQYRCFYVEEEVSSLPCHTPEECSKKPVKRKNVESNSTTTASKKPNSRNEKETVSTISAISVYCVLPRIIKSGTGATMSTENLENILRKAIKEEGISDQPLYVDKEEKVIKRQWCGEQFKGSV